MKVRRLDRFKPDDRQPRFVPITTGDGSSTFYSSAFGEWFHSRQGACHEAQTTYVETTRLAQRAQLVRAGGSLKILDICYGLGYNTAAALDTIWAVNQECPVELVALEIDIEVSRSAIAQNLTQRYSPIVQQVLHQLAADGSAQQHNLDAHILIGDARQQIQTLVAQNWQADVIFLDPFSPPNCPQLWTAEFLKLVAQCLKPHDGPYGGELVTYSCAAAVRASLQLANLAIGTIQTSARQWPGTIACHLYPFPNAVGALAPLSQQEQEHLTTRAAVPYRDPTLTATAEEILKRRHHEQATSQLMPTGPWRRQWATSRP
ncbi:MAG: hypothetical protein HC800_12975 [Phormidesmis sp. RL_2_1]|nr:hypothetical protein [Phormidesmis sp. RL_2_1]